MPKWANYYLVSLVNIKGKPSRPIGKKGRHKVIGDAASAYKDYYNIPSVRCFTMNTTYNVLGPGHVQGRVIGGTLQSKSGGNSLGLVSLDDKLIMVGHGHAEYGFELLDGGALADALCNAGLKNVGLIAFKSCLLGKGDFLGTLRDSLNARGVQFGWLVGYRDSAITVVKKNREGRTISVHENIQNKFKAFDTPWSILENLRRGELRQFGRVAVARGNTDLTRPGLRDYAQYV